MSDPLVSVIIPAYNHGPYIENCFDSIINQTYQNIELIVINDGSKDDTNEKIIGYEDKLKKRFSNFIHISKENEGVCKTLNLGLSLAQGKYIIPFASDDVMFSQRISKQVAFLEENSQYGMVYTDGYNVESKEYLTEFGNYHNEEMRLARRMGFAKGDLFDFMIDNVFSMPAPTVCIRKTCYDKVGPYDENLLAEDPDMFLRISKYFRIGCIEEPLVLHRLHGENSGKKSFIIKPALKSMIVKYENSDLLTRDEKERLLTLLEKTIGITNLERIKNNIDNKKIILWGTGQGYRKFIAKNNIDFEFFIDSDNSKQGQELDGKLIYPPQKLSEIDRNEFYILALSQFYLEIYEQLKAYGFKYKENFF
ncbi:MAG: glycosyltransferase family A protein [Peptococcia bacterium]